MGGGLSPGGLCPGDLCPGESLSNGAGSLCLGQTPPYSEDQLVRILVLEANYFLSVHLKLALSTD